LIRVEVNAGAALNTLQRMVVATNDRRTPNRQLSVQLYGWVLRNFQQGGSLQSPVWRPLVASTLKQKQRKGYSSKPLERSGHLRQSFRSFYDNEQAGVGSEVPYSQYHETGTRTLPQRAMLPSQQVALDYAIKVYDRWIAGIARSA
jgi:phage gpG-like protein